MSIRVRTAVTVVLLSVASVLVGSSPAQAEQNDTLRSADYYSGTYTRNFSATQQKYFSTIKRCVRISVRGQISFRLYDGYPRTTTYRTRRVIHPQMTVETLPACIIGPTQYKPSYKMTLSQRWGSSTCSAGVSISASIPWGVSVGAAPTCSKVNLAHRRTTYTGSTGRRTQSNSTTTVKFGDEYLKPIAVGVPVGPAPIYRAPLCFKVAVSAVVYPTKLSGSDSFDTLLNPCVKK